MNIKAKIWESHRVDRICLGMVVFVIAILLIGKVALAMEISTEKDLNTLEQEWAAAELRGDTASLNRLLTEDFIGIGPRGFMLTKAQWLDRYTSGALKYSRFAWDELRVRTYGDAAIMIGRQIQEGQYRDHDIRGKYRGTLIFVKQHGRWLLAGCQLSDLAEAPPGAGKLP